MSLSTHKEAITAQQKREAIEAMRRDSSLVHHCMTFADRDNLSPEDRYTLLAYHALAALAASQKALLEAGERRPLAEFLVDAMAGELKGAPVGLKPRVEWRVHYSKSGHRLYIADTISSRANAERAVERLSAEEGVSDIVVNKLVTFEFPAG
jgi:hypothetical protein